MTDSEESDSTGTARLLHELSEYDKLERDIGSEPAIAFTTNSLQRVSKEISREDLISTVKVCRLLSSGKINLARDRKRAEERADAAAAQLIETIKSFEKEEIDN